MQSRTEVLLEGWHYSGHFRIWRRLLYIPASDELVDQFAGGAGLIYQHGRELWNDFVTDFNAGRL